MSTYVECLPLDITIRPLQIKNDLKSILNLEESSTDLGTPLSEKDIIKAMKRKNTAGFVAVSKGRIVGFTIVEVFKQHFQLLNFIVHRSCRRRRVGLRLMAYLVDQLIPTQRKRVAIEVREYDIGMQLFLQFCKFRAIEILRTYYADTNEDGIKMEFRQEWPTNMVTNDKKGAFVAKPDTKTGIVAS